MYLSSASATCGTTRGTTAATTTPANKEYIDKAASIEQALRRLECAGREPFLSFTDVLFSRYGSGETCCLRGAHLSTTPRWQKH